MRTLVSRFALIVASAAVAAVSSAADEAQTVYVPGALAGSHPAIYSVIWALNNGGSDATIRTLTKWDPDGEHDLGRRNPVTLAPGEATYLYVDTSPDPWEAVQFLALSVPPGVVIRPFLERVDASGDFAGALTLPTFTSFVPPGTKTIAGNFRWSYAECVAGIRRRLNVTLFNAGDVSAEFHVDVATRSEGSDPYRTDFDYLVPPHTVRQINGVPYYDRVLCGGWGSDMGWVEITADQPSLAYASTVRQDAPGILPYEVFPALTGR